MIEGDELRPQIDRFHEPVMVDEVLRLLEPARGGTYMDGTAGGGGHTEAILERSRSASVLAVDRDPEALEVARNRLARFGDRVELMHANFAEAAESLGAPLAGALLDLGVSSHQIDTTGRGFSFRPGTPLDMRMEMDDDDRPTAADLLNTLAPSDLADIFFHFGEERRSRRLAREIVRRREEAPFATSDDLLEAIHAALGPRVEAQDKARLFQALRMAVNAELEALERALPALRDALEGGGVLAVLAYHSLEDRIVKNSFREWSRECICPPRLPVCRCRGAALGQVLTRKPLAPTDEEVAANPRARSARLRAWRKAA